MAQIHSAVALKVNGIESGLNTIKIIASLSPLIGLLGTVIGILNSFDSISHLGLGDPTVFSSGISIALITTVAGLIVAIPHYIGYNYFIGSLDKITKAGMIKNPPPAPTSPVKMPTTTPSNSIIG